MTSGKGKEGPRFLNSDLTRISVDEDKCRVLLQRFLKEHGRQEIYPIGEIIDIPKDNSVGMKPGLYSRTNFTPAELGQGEMLAVSHSTILSIKSIESGRLKDGQQISITPSQEFGTKEGYAILQIQITKKS